MTQMQLLCVLTLCLVQANIVQMERHEWVIDKGSENRTVYLPKDTVVEFMKKVTYISILIRNQITDRRRVKQTH